MSVITVVFAHVCECVRVNWMQSCRIFNLNSSSWICNEGSSTLCTWAEGVSGVSNVKASDESVDVFCWMLKDGTGMFSSVNPGVMFLSVWIWFRPVWSSRLIGSSVNWSDSFEVFWVKWAGWSFWKWMERSTRWPQHEHRWWRASGKFQLSSFQKGGEIKAQNHISEFPGIKKWLIQLAVLLVNESVRCVWISHHSFRKLSERQTHHF